MGYTTGKIGINCLDIVEVPLVFFVDLCVCVCVCVIHMFDTCAPGFELPDPSGICLVLLHEHF